MATAGWLPDPAGRHEHRYHDGQRWTDHVADAGNASTDPYVEVARSQEQLKESLAKISKWSDKHMQGAAGWVNRRGRKDQPDEADALSTLDDEAKVAVLGQWSGLANAVSKYAIATSGMVGGAELLGVLGAITGAEDAQGQLLRSIDTKVDALVKGPYNTGRTHLREAQRIGVDDPAHLHHIEQAKDCFYSAHGQAVSVQSRSLVEYHLGLTYLLLGRRDDAEFWLDQSHRSAVLVVDELAKQTENTKVLKSSGSTAGAALTIYPGMVVLGMKFKKMIAADRARGTLEDFLPFVECVANSYNGIVDDQAHPLPALSMVRVGQDQYEVRQLP